MFIEHDRLRLSDPTLSDSTLRVKNSGLYRLQYFEDYPDGNLAIGEAMRNIPFDIRRFYFINTLHHPQAVRGKHAHKSLEQAIFSINGSFALHLDDGEDKQIVEMDNPYIGVRLGPRLWHEMTDFSRECVILVLAADHYDEADYIRNYSDFLNHLREV